MQASVGDSPEVPEATKHDLESQRSAIFELLSPSEKKRVVLMASLVALVTPFTDTVRTLWLL